MTSSEPVGAFPPPPGVVPNFVNPESIAYRVVIASVLGPTIAIPICAVRLYTRRYILQSVGYDDYAIVLATILALAFSILTCYQINNGLGRHIWDVTAAQFYQLMKIGDIGGPIFYNISTLFIKVSLCLFYLRLKPFPAFQVACYTVMVISIIYSLLAAFGFAWVCQPIEKYWDFSILTGKCINLTAYFLATACINAGTDLALLILPIWIMKDLNLPLRRKIGVALLLMTGSLVCVVSIIRMKIVIDGMYTTALDGTWGMVANFIWILIEMWLGIICACLPSVHSFVRSFSKKQEAGGDNHGLPIFRDPNSGQVNAPDSGYHSGHHSGHSSDLDLDTLESEAGLRTTTSVIRPSVSNKNLLASVNRCDD